MEKAHVGDVSRMPVFELSWNCFINNGERNYSSVVVVVSFGEKSIVVGMPSQYSMLDR